MGKVTQLFYRSDARHEIQPGADAGHSVGPDQYCRSRWRRCHFTGGGTARIRRIWCWRTSEVRPRSARFAGHDGVETNDLRRATLETRDLAQMLSGVVRDV